MQNCVSYDLSIKNWHSHTSVHSFHRQINKVQFLKSKTKQQHKTDRLLHPNYKNLQLNGKTSSDFTLQNHKNYSKTAQFTVHR